jgi:hypothetical protein
MRTKHKSRSDIQTAAHRRKALPGASQSPPPYLFCGALSTHMPTGSFKAPVWKMGVEGKCCSAGYSLHTSEHHKACGYLHTITAN